MECDVDPSQWVREGVLLKFKCGSSHLQGRLLKIQKETSWIMHLSVRNPRNENTSETNQMRTYSIQMLDLQMLEHMAKQASNATSDPLIQAESYLIIGRNRQVLGDFQAALDIYDQARESAPNFPLACYRHSQVQAEIGLYTALKLQCASVGPVPEPI